MQACAGLKPRAGFLPDRGGLLQRHGGDGARVRQQFRKTAAPEALREFYRRWYDGGLVHVADYADPDGFLTANALQGKDTMELYVSGCDERLLLTARFDNLGKGASGAAIQNMNIVLGLDPAAGLEL